jgi:Domain of unknown function (DUF4404)
MSKQALERHLSELRRELDGTPSLDPETRERLERLTDELETALEEEEPDYASVRERVADAMLGFEAEHPRFAQLLSDVTDALAKLGI